MSKAKTRCHWCGDDPLYVAYHDQEWGRPVHDDRHLFELLILEGAQAGLSWITVLRKRENYRAAFDGFDPVKVAAYDEAKLASLMENPGIVRNRLKLASAVRNAKAFLAIQKEFGSFDRYLWGFVDGQVQRRRPADRKALLASNALSDRIAKDLKKRGMNFVGTTIIYAYLQACGIIDDHIADCFLATRA